MENEIEIEVNTLTADDLDGFAAQIENETEELLSGVEYPMLTDDDLNAWAADYEG